MSNVPVPVPAFLYVSSGQHQQTRVYHTDNCNGRLDNAERFAATEENVEMLRRLGYSPCKTCRLRYEKAMKARECAAVIESFNLAALSIPPEFELRVYWHREDRSQPTEIWNSRTGLQ